MISTPVASFIASRYGTPVRDVHVSLEQLTGGLESAVVRAHVETATSAVPRSLIVKEMRGRNRREADVYRSLSGYVPQSSISRIRSFWPYVLGPGSLSWAAMYFGGFHPALALVPIVPFMPHAPHDLGLFDAREALRRNTLDRFEHWWARPVQFILLLFGFANAGVPVAQMGPGTYYVLAALLLGKPVGILLFSGGARMVGARLPTGLHVRDLLVVGTAAAIGFTVSLFFATAAFPGGTALAETKMGALISFVAAPLAFVMSRVLQVRAHTMDVRASDSREAS